MYMCIHLAQIGTNIGMFIFFIAGEVVCSEGQVEGGPQAKQEIAAEMSQL